MALQATGRALRGIRGHKSRLGWGGALTVGLVAVNWRSIASHVGNGTGDIRERYSNVHGHARSIASALFRPFSSTAYNSFFTLSSSTTTMSLTPPQAPPTWEHTTEQVTQLTKDAIEKYRQVMDKVGSLDAKDANYGSV